jgi:HrpA-like RNA helicase
MLQVGALEGDEELTPLGYHLAKLPVDVLIGKVSQIIISSYIQRIKKNFFISLFSTQPYLSIIH